MFDSSATSQACTFKAPESEPSQACIFKAPVPTLESNPIDLKEAYKKQAKQYFGDTIDQFFDDLTGKELFECFADAAKEILSHNSNQFNKSVDLVNAIEHYA